jgi:hypothetical protein
MSFNFYLAVHGGDFRLTFDVFYFMSIELVVFCLCAVIFFLYVHTVQNPT